MASIESGSSKACKLCTCTCVHVGTIEFGIQLPNSKVLSAILMPLSNAILVNYIC